MRYKHITFDYGLFRTFLHLCGCALCGTLYPQMEQKHIMKGGQGGVREPAKLVPFFLFLYSAPVPFRAEGVSAAGCAGGRSPHTSDRRAPQGGNQATDIGRGPGATMAERQRQAWETQGARGRAKREQKSQNGGSGRAPMGARTQRPLGSGGKTGGNRA